MDSNPYHVLDANRGREHRSRPVCATPRPDLLRRLMAVQGNLVDHVAVKAIEAIFMSRGQPDTSGDVRTRIEEARDVYGAPALLRQPERFFRPVSWPGAGHFHTRRLGRLRGGERLLLTFERLSQTFDA